MIRAGDRLENPVTGEVLVFHRTSQETASGAPEFTGWSINVRCLDGVDLDAVPVKRVFGSRLP